MENEHSFTLNILTPQQLFLSRDVQALVCTTLNGKRGVLKNHMTAVMALDRGVLEVLCDGVRTNYVTSQGFLEVCNNVVNVFVQSCSKETDVADATNKAELLRSSETLRLREHRRNAVRLARIITKN
ncbi:MAG: hypothetical protein IJT27_07005 [Clostridia bacterium]|nr:hypothetical protein [Clostridia bacterium]